MNQFLPIPTLALPLKGRVKASCAIACALTRDARRRGMVHPHSDIGFDDAAFLFHPFAATAGFDVTIDWDTARKAFQQATGVPVPIGRRNYTRPAIPDAAATEIPAKLDLSLPKATDMSGQ